MLHENLLVMKSYVYRAWLHEGDEDSEILKIT